MFAIIIKQNCDIREIIANANDHKISQYADNISLILDGSPKSLFAALDTLDFFHIFQV